MSGLADTTLQLDSGARIPQVGLGVWQTPAGATTRRPCRRARVGYRHVDTARIYGNEADVGAAVRGERRPARAGLRDDQAVERRPGLRPGAARVRREPRAARPRLRRPLPHPLARRRASGSTRGARSSALRETGAPAPSASATTSCRTSRSCSATATRVPAVNQIELTPFLQRRETRALCAAARHRRRGVQPAHPRRSGSITRSSRRRAARGAHAGAGAAALGHPAGLRRAAEVDERRRASPRTPRCSTSRSTTAAMTELDALEEGLATGWDPAEQP